MLARCTSCHDTFRTETFGRQRCPLCGVEVELREPVVTAAAVVPALDGAAMPLPQGTPNVGNATPVLEKGGPDNLPSMSDVAPGPTPFEEREKLGFFRALGRTIEQVLFHPQQLFPRMQYRTLAGAPLYFALVAVIPAVLSDLYDFATRTTDAELDSQFGMLQQLPNLDPHLVEMLRDLAHRQNSPAILMGQVLTEPLLMFGKIFLFAGIAHLLLRAMGKAAGGWTGTAKAFLYAHTAGLLYVVPGCGGVLVWTWASALQIYGLMKAHRITFGSAATAVVGWHLTVMLPVLIAAAIALRAALSGLGSM